MGLVLFIGLIAGGVFFFGAGVDVLRHSPHETEMTPTPRAPTLTRFGPSRAVGFTYLVLGLLLLAMGSAIVAPLLTLR